MMCALLSVVLVLSIALPAFADDTNVEITVSTDESLNMTIYGSASNGTLEVWVNGVKLAKPHSHASLWAAIYSIKDENGKIIGNLIMLANETEKNIRILFANDRILASQIGVFSNSTLAEAIRNGNTTVVEQLLILGNNILFLKTKNEELRYRVSVLEEEDGFLKAEIKDLKEAFNAAINRQSNLQEEVYDLRARNEDLKSKIVWMGVFVISAVLSLLVLVLIIRRK